MNFRLTPWGLALAAFAVAVLPAFATEPAQIKSDEATLKKADLATDGKSLVEFFRRRIANDKQEEAIKKNIELLGDRRFSTRRKAMDELLRIGPPALAQLEVALNNDDLEIQKRSEELIGALRTMMTADLVGAAVRLLGHHKPDGAAAVLIDFLPSTSDAYVIDEIRFALQAVAVKKDKDKTVLDEAVLKGIEDKNAIKRAAAAEVVARLGDADQRKKVKELLKDKSAQVRHRVALGLLDHQDKDAVAVLVKLLTEVDRSQVWTIEEVLVAIAGDKSPRVSLGSTDNDRAKFAKGWSEWWDKDGSKQAVPKLDPASRVLGFTLLCLLDNSRANPNTGLPIGKVMEIDQNKKARWTIDNLNYPTDAVMISSNKVAVLEQNNTLRVLTTGGDELWKKQLNTSYYGMQKLNNGNIFLYSRLQVAEYDNSGKEVATVTFNQGGGAVGRTMIYSAAKAPNGEIVTLQRNVQNRTSEIVRYDAAGKELKRYSLNQQVITTITRIDALANGNVVVPFYNTGKVIEYDGEGKTVLEFSAAQATSAQRLPNGRTFLGSRYQRYAMEVDGEGKEVWKHTEDGNSQIMQTRRR